MSYHTDTDLTYHPNNSMNMFNIGTKINYESKNLSIKSKISYYLYTGLELENGEKPDDFNPYSGFGRVENNPGLKDNQFNYFFSTIELSYKMDKLNIYSGFNSPKWGRGVSNIILSDKAPLYFNLGYIWKINSKFIYEHLHGSLVSSIEDPSCNSLYLSSNRYTQSPRSISAHKLLYKAFNKFWITFYEVLVYGGSRNFDPSYYLPLLPLLPIQTYHGDLDNDQIGLGLDYYSNNFDLYFILAIDEWSPSLTFKEAHKNWFIWQLGVNKRSLFTNNDDFTIEYIWSDYRVYKHRFEINDYYSYGYPLGFWAGPHAEQFFMDYNFNIMKHLDLSLSYLNVKRGNTPDEIITSKYNHDYYFERYSEGFEKKDIISLIISFNLLDNNFVLDLGINYIKWYNPSYNIEFSDDLPDLVVKNDYFASIKYEL